MVVYIVETEYIYQSLTDYIWEPRYRESIIENVFVDFEAAKNAVHEYIQKLIRDGIIENVERINIDYSHGCFASIDGTLATVDDEYNSGQIEIKVHKMEVIE